MNSITIKKVVSPHLFGLSILRIFICLGLFGIGICSCSKDDNHGGDSGDYYLRATLDGRKINFHNVKFQGGGNDNRWEHIVVGGTENSYPSDGSLPSPSLDFEIWKEGGNITTGTYATPAEKGMIARYAIQKKDGTLVYNTSNGNDIFTINIEEISKAGIKGTLAGKVQSMDGSVINVTEGSFNLPYDVMVNP